MKSNIAFYKEDLKEVDETVVSIPMDTVWLRLLESIDWDYAQLQGLISHIKSLISEADPEEVAELWMACTKQLLSRSNLTSLEQSVLKSATLIVKDM